MITTIILFALMLTVLIFVHELGHFLLAKAFGIRVDEFAIGFPPRIWAKKIGKTLFAINAIPFGGYVKIFGEDGDPSSETEKVEAFNLEKPKEDLGVSIMAKPKWVQILVLVAGISFNIIFAWLIISTSFMIGSKASASYSDYPVKNPQIIITTVSENSPAAKAGIKAGDEILSVKNTLHEKSAPNLQISDVQNLISETKMPIVFSLRRDSGTTTASTTPEDGIVPGKRAVGISMDVVGELKLNPFQALVFGAKTTYSLVTNTAVSLYDFIITAVMGKAKLGDVSGPVGIASYVGQASRLGFSYLISFMAFISINLAVINLVPFPALDGGRILFILIEAIIRRPINQKVTQYVNTIGFALLIILMLVVTFKDIIKLIG